MRKDIQLNQNKQEDIDSKKRLKKSKKRDGQRSSRNQFEHSSAF